MFDKELTNAVFTFLYTQCFQQSPTRQKLEFSNCVNLMNIYIQKGTFGSYNQGDVAMTENSIMLVL